MKILINATRMYRLCAGATQHGREAEEADAEVEEANTWYAPHVAGIAPYG